MILRAALKPTRLDVVDLLKSLKIFGSFKTLSNVIKIRPSKITAFNLGQIRHPSSLMSRREMSCSRKYFSSSQRFLTWEKYFTHSEHLSLFLSIIFSKCSLTQKESLCFLAKNKPSPSSKSKEKFSCQSPDHHFHHFKDDYSSSNFSQEIVGFNKTLDLPLSKIIHKKTLGSFKTFSSSHLDPSSLRKSKVKAAKHLKYSFKTSFK